MPKLPNWQTRLTEYLLRIRREGIAHSWAKFSCAKFVGGAIEAQTGVDPHAPFQDTYTSAAEARDALKAAGFFDLPAFIAEQGPEVTPIMAHFGDIILVSAELPVPVEGLNNIPEEVRFVVGVAEPPYYWVMTDKGIGRAPLILNTRNHLFKAYRVGTVA